MLKFMLSMAVVAFGAAQPIMAQDRILISSRWVDVTADLADNPAADAL